MKEVEMASDREANREHQRRFKARQQARGLRPLVLRVPPGHVAAHEAAAAGRPRELERLRKHVEGKVREHVLEQLDRWTHRALVRQARQEARKHPAGSNAPPARLRFGKRPPHDVSRKLREAGWWYDWIASVWNRPDDPDRWHGTDALIAEVTAAAGAQGVSVLPLAPGPDLADLGASLVPPRSMWQRERLNVTGRPSWRTNMKEAQRDQVFDLRKPTPKEARDWKWESELRSLHVWARAGDVEAHQLAAWQPHALARLRDRLTVELAPEVRALVAARMARQVENARRMQERAGQPSVRQRQDRDEAESAGSSAGDGRKTSVIPDWILQGQGGAPRPWPRRGRRGLIRPGAFFPAQLLAALRPSAALAALRP